MKAAVIVFPGSNCDHDMYNVLKHVMHIDAKFLWHKETDLGDVDAVFLPGGFSFGDFLRTGSIARFSPVMEEVIKFAINGGLVMGVCNGFQVLCEAGLLPGVLRRNSGLDFICREVTLKVENTDTRFTNRCSQGQILKMPVAHGEGNYFAEPDVIKRLEDNGQVVFRYASADGVVDDTANINGSINNIAGICNEQGNVLGMMPHPERASERQLGSVDGKIIFESIVAVFGALV
ncbi:phosphoribosylformylglycinamidine synthase subunit PurQ [candidate division KSB1 bacterium]|nr:phosphoribosylformylglycinamidine synthase subunit PurQ [candidate division KSB1 bacterium]